MKKPVSGLVLSIGMAAAAHAAAPSSVTLFGVMDVALSYQTHVSPGGHSRLGLQQGNEGFLSGSRFGLKGSEDLGDGWQAGFMLENGFLANTGKRDQQGQIFGRQLFVKLGHARYGDLALGRQYTVGNTLLYYVDPLGVGAAPSNAWQVYLVGQRYDNAFSYTVAAGPWQLLAEYAAGGLPGDRRAPASTALGLRYQHDGLTAVGGMQRTHDTQRRRARLLLGGAAIALGDATLFANTIHSDRDAGFDASDGGTDFASITSMTSGSPSAPVTIHSVFAPRRRDDFFTLGAHYRMTPAWHFTLSMMLDRTRANGFSGARKTWYGVAGYRLSRRTDVYAAAVYERTDGGWSGLFGNRTPNISATAGQILDGQSSQHSALIGLRHVF